MLKPAGYFFEKGPIVGVAGDHAGGILQSRRPSVPAIDEDAKLIRMVVFHSVSAARRIACGGHHALVGVEHRLEAVDIVAPKVVILEQNDERDSQVSDIFLRSSNGCMRTTTIARGVDNRSARPSFAVDSQTKCAEWIGSPPVSVCNAPAACRRSGILSALSVYRESVPWGT